MAPPMISQENELSNNSLKWDKRGQTHSWSCTLQDENLTLHRYIFENQNQVLPKTLEYMSSKKRGKEFSLKYRVEQMNVCEALQDLIDRFKNNTFQTHDESFSKRNRQSSPGRNYKLCSSTSIPVGLCQNAHGSQNVLESSLTGYFQLYVLAGAASYRITATRIRSQNKARIIFELYSNEARVKPKQPMNCCGWLHTLNILSIFRRVTFIAAVAISHFIYEQTAHPDIRIWIVLTEPIRQCYYEHLGEESQEKSKKNEYKYMLFTPASSRNDLI